MLFTPAPDRHEINRAITILERRDPVTLRLAVEGGLFAAQSNAADHTAWQDDAFVVRHDPILRLMVMGDGTEPAAMLDIALAYGADAILLSPQVPAVDQARAKGISADVLRFVGRADGLPIDAWTAVVTLFTTMNGKYPC